MNFAQSRAIFRPFEGAKFFQTTKTPQNWFDSFFGRLKSFLDRFPRRFLCCAGCVALDLSTFFTPKTVRACPNACGAADASHKPEKRPRRFVGRGKANPTGSGSKAFKSKKMGAIKSGLARFILTNILYGFVVYLY